MFVYECSKCHREFEFNARGDYFCQDHKKTKLDRVYGLGGVIFKGGGFHKTDSRSKK